MQNKATKNKYVCSFANAIGLVWGRDRRLAGALTSSGQLLAVCISVKRLSHLANLAHGLAEEVEEAEEAAVVARADSERERAEAEQAR